MTAQTSGMADLVATLERARLGQENVDGLNFLPEAILREKLSEPAILKALEDAGIPLHDHRDLTRSILAGARKCFAILISIGCPAKILEFFRRDTLQKSHPDDRLPYNSQALEQIFETGPDDLAVSRFLKMQWELTVPVLREHTLYRELDKRVILPLLDRQAVGKGSMGVAWKVTLHEDCHQLPVRDNTVIQKQIAYGPGKAVAFQKELENLALLTHLRHPNIIPLYCSYAYHDHYNFIFPVAQGGSLAALLGGEEGAGAPRGSQLLVALTDLASAINAMHNFTADTIDLSRSGCHHDLAPRNILLHNDTFLLADFGLSTFKDAEEDSGTPFKQVHGTYIAPESQTLPSLTPQRMGRAGDIWSFGCIIAELMTYMVSGPTGVRQFRDARKSEIVPGILGIRFYNASGAPSSQVLDWLAGLQHASTEPCSEQLVALVRRMLSAEPAHRPRSAQVLAALQGIAILSLATRIGGMLEAEEAGRPNGDRVLIQHYLKSWLFAFHEALDAHRDRPEDFIFDFPQIIQTLREMESLLGERPGGEDGVAPLPSLLRHQHARLLGTLPPPVRSSARDHLVRSVLQEADAEELTRLSAAMSRTGDEDIGVLLAFRHLVALAERGDLSENKELILNHRHILLERPVDIHHLASIRSTSRRIIVEWLRYGGLWADEDIREVLRQRLTSVVALLSAGSAAQIPGSLHCVGLFHDPTMPAIGVAYDLPDQESRPITLHALLLSAPHRPLLEHRFRLAMDICRSVHAFHRVGWLHRNINSMNILFFPSQEAKKADWATNPRILGFSGSRESRLDAFSHGPDIQSQLKRYHHPEYAVRHARYREDFDYYSVGMVLLEIGMWDTLSNITKSARFRDLTADRFRDEVMSSRVSGLGLEMGTRYMEATRRCLEGGFGDQEAPFLLFEKRVIACIPDIGVQ